MPKRPPHPDDWLAASDISDWLGIPLTRSESLIRALVKDGCPVYRIRGFSRKHVRRGDIEARIEEHTWEAV